MIRHFSLPTLQKKILFSTSVQYLGKFIQIGLGIISLKLISNFLSANDYGIYAKITEYALFFSVIANLGIFGNLVRKMADHPQDGKIFINGLFLRIASAFSFFLIGFIILLINSTDRVFLIGSILFFSALFFDYITSVCDAALQAQYRMGRATLALVCGRLLNVGLLFFMITSIDKTTTSNPLIFLFLPLLVGSIFTAGLSFYLVKRSISWSFTLNIAFVIDILKTSLPFGVINIMNNLYFRFIPDLLANSGGLSNSEFATYNISFKIAQVLSLFSTFLMFSVMPGLKEYIDLKDWQKVKKLYRKIGLLLGVCGIILFATGSLFGPTILELLTDKKYFLPQFWFVFPMMLFLAAVSYGYDLILIGLFALEKDFWLLKREFFALSCASIFFILSLSAENVILKLFLILCGAILGESMMVLLGVRKMKTELAKHI